MEYQKISGLIAYPTDDIIMSPESAYKFFMFGPAGAGSSKKMFKMQETHIPFAKGVIQYDVKMGRKHKEDIIFENNPNVMFNMRRGLSFLVTDISFRKKLLEAQEEQKSSENKEEEDKPKNPNPKKQKKPKKEVKKEKDIKKPNVVKQELEEEKMIRDLENEQNEEEEQFSNKFADFGNSDEDVKNSEENINESKPKIQENIGEKPIKEQKIETIEKVKEIPKNEEKTEKLPEKMPEKFEESEKIKEEKVEKVEKIEEKPKEKERILDLSKPIFLVSRKGLMKFFDIDTHCFDKDFHLPVHDNKTNFLFGPVQENLNNHIKIEIFATRKANGENAQISYIPIIDAWIIASKNVSLCARNSEDIEYYTGESKFQFAREIGSVWFRMLENIENNDKLDELKKAISNKTMVGEYVGHIDHQHLVKYGKETILFYAIVDNNGITNCIGPRQAMEIFDNFGLDHVSIESRGIYENMTDLLSNLKNLYVDTAYESLENEEEGLAVYLATYSLKEDYTIGLCKLKTLEYRIFRKLRENLKNQMRKSFGIFKFLSKIAKQPQ